MIVSEEDSFKTISILKSTVSRELVEIMVGFFIEYRDTREVNEHLCDIHSATESKEKYPKSLKEEIKQLLALANEHEASYVRFID